LEEESSFCVFASAAHLASYLFPHEIQILRHPTLPRNIRHPREVINPLPRLKHSMKFVDIGGIDPIDVAIIFEGG
jgi:hypothetical protein